MPVVRFVWWSVREVSAGIIGSGILGVFFFALAETLGYFWPPFALLIYGIALLLLLFSFLFVLRVANFADRSSLANRINELRILSVANTVGYLLTFIFLSGQFLRHWSLQFGGFSPGSGGTLAWTAYAISWMLDNGLGNFGQIFGWNISSIHPTNDTARTLLWVYNLLLEFLAIAAVVKVVGVLATYRRESRRQNASA